jgi:4-hydroxybenzoate polyprenyltransferase
MTEESTSSPRAVTKRCVKEARLTRLLLADNVVLCVLPPLLFALAASLHVQATVGQTLAGVGRAALLSLMFAYVFDSSNQSRAGEEDVRNKPHRPIPAGLTDANGLTRRFLCVMPLYTLTGWLLGVLAWVLLWQVTTLFMWKWAPPHRYTWWKTPTTMSGAFTQLGTGWQVVAPLDSTAWRWMVVVCIYMPLACVYEDVRDMPGDRVIGRRTAPLIWGDRPVRIWFAAFLVALPAVSYALLIGPEHASPTRTISSLILLCLLAWMCAVRALRRSGNTQDRFTYQFFTLTWAVVLGTASLLWWP